MMKKNKKDAIRRAAALLALPAAVVLGTVPAFADVSFAPMFMWLGVILVAVIAVIVIAAVLLARKSAERRRMSEMADFAGTEPEDGSGEDEA